MRSLDWGSVTSFFLGNPIGETKGRMGDGRRGNGNDSGKGEGAAKRSISEIKKGMLSIQDVTYIYIIGSRRKRDVSNTK